MRTFSLVALLLFLVADSGFTPVAHAQPLKPGTRYRVSTADTQQIGRFEAGMPDSLQFVRASGQPFVVARSDLTRLEVRKGNGAAPKVAMAGGGMGMLIGGLVGACWTSEGELLGEDFAWCSGEYTLRGVFIGLGVGASVGTLVGLAIRKKTWVAVPLGTATIEGRPNGIALAVRW